jgi:hypothetical protein
MQRTSYADPPVCQIKSFWRAGLPRMTLNPIILDFRGGLIQEVPSRQLFRMIPPRPSPGSITLRKKIALPNSKAREPAFSKLILKPQKCSDRGALEKVRVDLGADPEQVGLGLLGRHPPRADQPA